MADLLKIANTWLQTQRGLHMARLVTYSRGVDGVELLATIGRTEFEQDDGYNLVQRSEARDFIIDAEALEIKGSPVTPAEGDQVRMTREPGKVDVYEVAAFGAEPPYRWSDAYHTTYRVHTKHVATEETA